MPRRKRLAPPLGDAPRGARPFKPGGRIRKGCAECDRSRGLHPRERRLMSSDEGSLSKARVEAFSDGVLAVIITVMVLDLKAPRSSEASALVGLWPSFAIYLVSFFLTTIYWINHHVLITQARRVTMGLLWANSAVLFAVSLIPFATAYVAQTRLAPFPTAIYAGQQCSAASPSTRCSARSSNSETTTPFANASRSDGATISSR